MLKKLRMMANFFCVGFGMFLMAGCIPIIIGAAAGAGGVAYAEGILTKNLDEPIDRLHKISLSALKGLKMTIDQERISGARSIIKAFDVDRSKITVTIEKLTEKSSKLNIRVGVFGDQTKSQMILNAIQKKL